MTGATATVTMKIHVKNCGRWNDAATIGQLKEQAIESALSKLRILLKNDPDIDVLGEPEATLLWARDEIV